MRRKRDDDDRDGDVVDDDKDDDGDDDDDLGRTHDWAERGFPRKRNFADDEWKREQNPSKRNGS